jgi:hypothetical protein
MARNLNILGAEAGGSRDPGQPGILSRPASKKKKRKEKVA